MTNHKLKKLSAGWTCELCQQQWFDENGKEWEWEVDVTNDNLSLLKTIKKALFSPQIATV